MERRPEGNDNPRKEDPEDRESERREDEKIGERPKQTNNKGGYQGKNNSPMQTTTTVRPTQRPRHNPWSWLLAWRNQGRRG